MPFSVGSFSSSSPVIGIQPQHVHQMTFNKPFFPQQSQLYKHSAPCPPGAHLRSNSIFAGRKRSRDEAAANLDEPEKTVPAPSIEESEDDWEYGPGMTMIKKKAGYVVDAGSQSGTWVEEKAAEEHAQKIEAAIAAQEQLAQERPSLRSNKSQRLDMTKSNLSAGQVIPSSPGREKSPDAPSQPIIDDFTLHLGIGWGRISEGEHIKAATRGWNRFIENHYPVTNAQIRLESKGLESYLVEAAEGFFLFAENLRQGRLVSRNAQRALQNLKSSPPVFDGPEIMTAAATPQPNATPSGPFGPAAQKTNHTDIMDMS